MPQLYCDVFSEMCTITFDPSALAGAFLFTLILGFGIWAASVLEKQND